MASYINIPDLYFRFLRPQKMSFKTQGGSISGGSNLLGEGISINMTGGGSVVASYEECFVFSPEQHEYVNYLVARMNKGTRFLNVPIFTDWAGPFPTSNGAPVSVVSGIPHSDGSFFSDSSGYSQATVWGKILSPAALYAGQIDMRVYDAQRPLRWSDWFSIHHNRNGTSSRGWRAYSYWENQVLGQGTETVSGALRTYTDYRLAIEPALREAVVADMRVEFALPKCVMKFPAGFELEWRVEGFWQSRPSLQFTEAF